ncbi:hypothetical protein GS399_17245 [Pedobacter sp. HMF7647]|uniref:Porin n=1 Tax=Hufsiella arboris TaxID=2695275 RepID=A0A7K1YEC4_9SPHI|nr:putative porin [Hufsiella arboris]MXV52721.1 hypothetical protein [Hufsiella arboris]
MITTFKESFSCSLKYVLFIAGVMLISLSASQVSAQVVQPAPQPPPNQTPKDPGAEIDSLRKREEGQNDTVVITAKYIRYTNIGLLSDSTKTIPIDTTDRNFENYNPLFQPETPTMNLGNMGLDYRYMLFTPRKNIGFDAGFHNLDMYLLTEDSLKYYRARSPFSSLYYVNGGQAQQLFQVIHSQNIKPNWNIGANYNRIGGNGFYTNQQPNHTNIALFTWYESPKKRYNLQANVIWNTLKAAENGSVINDSLFTSSESLSGSYTDVKLQGTRADQPRQTWRNSTFFIRQSYFIGRIDSAGNDTVSSVLPTQRVSYTLQYSRNRYKFYRNEPDNYDALPDLIPDDGITQITNDSTEVKNLHSEFFYSFYLRGKSVKFIKNELKLDLGLLYDIYWYRQMQYKKNFQNITLQANVGYRFSDRVNIVGKLSQIAQGENAGDFLYEANTNFLLSRSVGRIVLGAYMLNKSPEQLYEKVNYQFYSWDNNFDRTKTTNLSFLYENPKYSFSAKAEYYLVSNYLYYAETYLPRKINPFQESSDINLLKISAGKNFTFGKFGFNTFVAYQKTDSRALLRIPEFYGYGSLYFSTPVFKVLKATLGVDARFNTPYAAPAYDLNTSQFYNDISATEFSSYPVFDPWLKATLKRANLFVKYNYANEGLFSKGFYTVNRYPMQKGLLTFGVRWNFYN